MKQVNLEHLLARIEKPSRYIDNEINACHKDFESSEFRACFCFPDLYELGVSHLGLKILYSVINRLDWAMADRAYLPWLDMIKLMREENIPLWGLESKIPLKDFDLVGITLQSELTYSNVLESLGLAGIRVKACERGEEEPIVIAGGPCATNPLPLVDFIDVFFIGEAEIGIIEIAGIFRDTKGRTARLEALAKLSSCYVPQIHSTKPMSRIKARKFADFHDGSHSHSPQILSWQLATHNRYVAEIMRGCSRGCRFCHAGYFYRPVRERDADQILGKLLEETRQTGWDEAGLISLSSSDYSCIKPLLLNLLNALDTNQTHVSLPSLRVDSLDEELVQNLKDLGREGLTIAPEAGSQRLRDVINKNLSEAEILRGVETALKLGWQRIKLYFMIGLPTETEEDIQGIIDLINKIDGLARKRLNINVTLSPFVPKVFTPFQWEAFAPVDQSLQRIMMVKNEFKTRRNIKIKYHNLESSLLEAVLSRGDQYTSKLVYQAWEDGAIYDGWHESFSWQIWEKAASKLNLDLSSYYNSFDVDEELPWDFVDTRICKSFLILERAKAYRAEGTPDCRELCSMCGVCENEVHTVDAPVPGINIEPVKTDSITNPPNLQNQFHYRVHYSKTGMLRFIAHLDWMRMLFRWIGSLALETVFTQGYNPHPKVSLSPPLPIGIHGRQEYFDVSYLKDYAPEVILEQYKQIRLPGFDLLRVEKLAKRNSGQIAKSEEIQIIVPEDMQAGVRSAIEAFSQTSEYLYTKVKDNSSKTYNLSQIIRSMDLREDNLVIKKSLESPALYSILEEILKLDRNKLYTLKICRQGFFFD